MPAAVLPPDVENWPSHAFWRAPESRVKQHWYVSFCLMMSSVQDRLTGLALQESGNLNWATTAFYYSAVHAGRLVCFVCTGDYPTKHTELAALLAPTQVQRNPKPDRLFHFDWLETFMRYVGRNQHGGGGPAPQNQRLDRDAIIRALGTKPRELRVAFDKFAPLLARFKNLRNDCNYEALLVAHERNHVIDDGSNEDRGVTQGFRVLVSAAERASRIAADLATDAYLEHVKSADCFATQRDQFHIAHTQYVEHRFRNSLDQKFQGSARAMDELRRTIERLKWPETSAGNADQFLVPIMYDTFGEKQGLMQRWQDDIRTLVEALREARTA
ncbi:MAG: hypothetical protein HZB38_08610 [Planctomycetes bacterium]|nr:hypothetical protein [Planctomycetota bacterium]